MISHGRLTRCGCPIASSFYSPWCSEYLGECATYRRMPEILNQAAFLVPRLEWQELRQAAVEPLGRWRQGVEASGLPVKHGTNFKLDPNLLDLLLDAVAQSKDDPDHLPLFQHALGHLWWLAQEDAANSSEAVTIGPDTLVRALGLPEYRGLEAVPMFRSRLRGARGKGVRQPHGGTTASCGDPAAPHGIKRRLRARRAAFGFRRRHRGMRRLLDEGSRGSGREARRGSPRLRTASAGGHQESLIDVAHVELPPELATFLQLGGRREHSLRDLLELSQRARKWVEQGHLLDDDGLALARRWQDATLLDRSDMPASLRAWAERYHGGMREARLGQFDGPEGAIDELYHRSVAEFERLEDVKLQEVQREAERAEREQRSSEPRPIEH